MSFNIGGGYTANPVNAAATRETLNVSRINPAVSAVDTGTPADVPVQKPGGFDPSLSVSPNNVQINTSTVVRVNQTPSKNVASLAANAAANLFVNAKLGTNA